MSDSAPRLDISEPRPGILAVDFRGDWTLGETLPDGTESLQRLAVQDIAGLEVRCNELGDWDSALMALLFRFHETCVDRDIPFETSALPEGARRLLSVGTAVRTHQRPETPKPTLAEQLDPRRTLNRLSDTLETSLGFIGEVTLAIGKLLIGRANTRRSDLFTFLHQAGPRAFGIISLTSFLVGMILAYLGAAQLQQFGAQIYVADLVVVGMLREMGVLMTAVVMAGRTGAAYAAQLGTMQTREEIDAVVTMGISPIEFLVLPRILALVLIMPLLTVYANVIGILGGALVALGMDVTLVQFIGQARSVTDFNHLGVGLFKSVVFAILIAVAGCRAGINCGRSSAAVGEATTKAVVVAIVYLIVADAAINILMQNLGI
jgi:phospholipid/cholesterol/gamma-HCH transport system permease protein